MHSEEVAKSMIARGDSSIVEMCRTSFESELNSVGKASIEAWLERVPIPVKSELFTELLKAEVKWRQTHGLEPTPTHYRDRFPEYGHQIEAVFEQPPARILKLSDSVSMVSTIDYDGHNAGKQGQHAPWKRGATVGRYRLDRFIAQGAFGEVWQGFDPDLNRIVAIKVPRAERPSISDDSLTFREEARRAALLKDDGIVPVFDVGRVETGFFIVSEFIDGPTLAQRMKTEIVPRDEAVRIIRSLALTLEKAHRMDLIHRDIKPSNILLRRDGSLTITDFGLAVTEAEQLTLAPAIAGTLIYMSPEQARGETRLLDGRSDLYSLGVIFFQLLTGRLPFQYRHPADLLEQIRHREVRSLRSFDSSIPKRLDDICSKCLAKNVRDRYATGGDLAADLATWNRPSAARTRTLLIAFLAVLFAVSIVNFMIGWWSHTTNASSSPRKTTDTAPAISAQWLPMLDEPLNNVVFQRHHDTDFIHQDQTTNTLTARAEDSFWILTTRHTGKPPLQMRGSFHVDKWVGSVGFVWGLSRPLDSFPEKPPRCFVCVVERFSADEPLLLSIRELETRQFDPDRLDVGPQNAIATTAINIPKNSPTSLVMDVTESGINVQIDGEAVWKPDILDSSLKANPATTVGQVGIILRGGTVLVRDAAVKFMTSTTRNEDHDGKKETQ